MLSYNGNNYKTTHVINKIPAYRSSSTFLIICVLIFSLFYIQSSFAQDSKPVRKPVKYKNVNWFKVDKYKIKEGKVEQFVENINKFYVQAAKASGQKPAIIMTTITGPWDVIVISSLKGGPGDLEYKVSQADINRSKQFLKIVGKDKAMKLFNQYQADIVSHDSYIAFQNN